MHFCIKTHLYGTSWWSYNMTDFHYSWPSKKIYVAYFMYPLFLIRPNIVYNFVVWRRINHLYSCISETILIWGYLTCLGTIMNSIGWVRYRTSLYFGRGESRVRNIDWFCSVRIQMNSALYTSMLNDLFISHLRFDFQTANNWARSISY